MKFKLVDTLRYWWPIVVNVPDPDNAGKFQKQQLKILFETQDQDTALAAQEAYEKLTTVRERVEHERKQLLDVVKGWDDVEDAEKVPVPFTEEAFRAALQKSWFRTAVFNGHTDSLIGREAALGN
ncbi:hypothetical protein [Neorhizobium petrolearium]|uniref:hypothetical protein n=1 Tax=Neorhizobium petrolearium TaxID=515361 RepID=UPI003F8057A0